MRLVGKILAVLVIAVALILAGLAMFTTPLYRVRSYAQFMTSWSNHWPLSRGQYLPYRVAPVLESVGFLQKVRYEIEPGVAFMVEPKDVIEVGLLATGTWDEDIWDWIKGYLQPGRVMIDVGAHIGTMTLRGAKAVGETGKVLAVEPNPDTVAKLQANIAASHARNIIVEPVAAGSKPGELELFIGSKINSGTSSLSKENAEEHGAHNAQSVKVPIQRLDDLVEKAGLTRIDIIKVDVEGAETQVLTGGMESIKKYHPVLVLETVDAMLKNMGSSLAELEALLQSLGYERTRESADHANAIWSPKTK